MQIELGRVPCRRQKIATLIPAFSCSLVSVVSIKRICELVRQAINCLVVSYGEILRSKQVIPMKVIHNTFSVIILGVLLSACGGESVLDPLVSANTSANSNVSTPSSSDESTSSTNDASPSSSTEKVVQIFGAGMKGPLAFADVKIYRFEPDAGKTDFYNEHNPLSAAVSNDSAQVAGLSVPADIPPPYVLVIGGDLAVDLDTGKAPVISNLVTIITEDMLASGRPIYATPLTTLAFHMASFGSGISTNASHFLQMINDAAGHVETQFSINKNINIDIFRSPVIIDNSTITVSAQEEAVYHRAALEAFAAKVHQLSMSLGNVSTDSIIKSLAVDLMNDGRVDNRADGVQVGSIDPNVILQNPMSLMIPNTNYRIEEVASLMAAERNLIGTDNGPTFHADSFSLEYSVDSSVADWNVAENTPPTESTAPVSIDWGVTGGDLTSIIDVNDNETITLECGAVYYGTLNLSGKSGVTINTPSNCSPATITPLEPISGFTLYSGNIYVADVPNPVDQVIADSVLLEEAHYPNNTVEKEWLIPDHSQTRDDSIVLSNLPSTDLVGARAVYRSWAWQVSYRTVLSYDGNTITLTGAWEPGSLYGDSPLYNGKFYFEGKLWMLDQPGEWAYSDGRLYVWMPDGGAPDLRVRASKADVKAINADYSSNITLNNIRVIGGSDGISAIGSNGLEVLNSEIKYSSSNAINLDNGNGANIDNSNINNALRNGIHGGWGKTDNINVSNSTFTDMNMHGMHKGSDGAMLFYQGDNITVTNNVITNSGKTAIWAGKIRNSLIEGNVIDGACLQHADCGAIYTFNRDCYEEVVFQSIYTRVACSPLNLTIKDNIVRNVTGVPLGAHDGLLEDSWGILRRGIYLDDAANGVTVINNIMDNANTGLFIHGGSDNVISNNTFLNNEKNPYEIVPLMYCYGDYCINPTNNTFSDNAFL